jgi:hypothetical protein
MANLITRTVWAAGLAAVVVSGCGPSGERAGLSAEARAIHRVFDQRDQMARELDGLPEQVAREQAVKRFGRLVASQERRDLTGCPADFRAAFADVLDGNRRILRVLSTYRDEYPTSEDVALVRLLSPTDPDLTPAERDILRAYAEAEAATNTLYAIAERYGVHRRPR